MQAVLQFVSQLKPNNTREWLEANRPMYESAKAEFSEFVRHIIKDLSQLEPGFSLLEPKDCIFRIHRDIRFSKNKTPYKTHFGAYFAEGGKKSTKAGYYLHIEPDGKSMLAGGVYMPPPEDLKKIRQEIDYNGEQLRNILNTQSFKKYYGTITGEKLKTTPKGYSPEHPDIELLKQKDFIATHYVEDSTVIQPDYLSYCMKAWKALKPLNDFMNAALDS
ncbi:DUF2461 domain-containing protein [Rhodocytophaga aerolata]|uniref:DUF2461 domain-containing protein n=1 Tax=Rhodocytophaga aerolata TaxID=455078 RepID=A0ABT8R5F0_9BACT|nr:DUF2461 domain-containing protein [Rhodocytophaga aerolata]MDO1447318.1 DUF2461 domain-containing protein [Rhodocytophaga aerolata]